MVSRDDDESKNERHKEFQKTMEPRVKMLYPRLCKLLGQWCQLAVPSTCTPRLLSPPLLSVFFFPTSYCFSGDSGDRKASLHGNLSHPAPLIFLRFGSGDHLEG